MTGAINAIDLRHRTKFKLKSNLQRVLYVWTSLLHLNNLEITVGTLHRLLMKRCISLRIKIYEADLLIKCYNYNIRSLHDTF